MNCIDINSLSVLKTVINYGKFYTNYIYSENNNIDILVKNLPIMLKAEINNEIETLIKTNNSSVEQYELYLYSETELFFEEWLYNMRKSNILSYPKYNSIYIGIDKEIELSKLYDNQEINDVLATKEQDLLLYLEKEEIYEEEPDWNLEEKLLYFKYRDKSIITKHRQKLLQIEQLEKLTTEPNSEKRC